MTAEQEWTLPSVNSLPLESASSFQPLHFLQETLQLPLPQHIPLLQDLQATDQIRDQFIGNLRLRSILINLSTMTVNTTVNGSDILVQLGKFAVDLVNDHFRHRLEDFVLLLDVSL